MTEVDNLCFALAMPERIQSRVQDAARVTLTDGEARALSRIKAAHVGLVVLSCLLVVKVAGMSLSVKLFGNPSAVFILSLTVIPMTYWLGAVLEAVGTGLTAAQFGCHAAKAMGARLLSFVATGILMVLMTPGGVGNQSAD